MRGAPDIGSIKFEAEVVVCHGGFKGRLAIPHDGTRFTEVKATKQEAAADLDALQRKILPEVGLGNGFSEALQADINERLAAL